MADSDDDYDKKRRDKFQGERVENYRDRRKDEDWGRSRIRGDYRDRYYADVPPPKRIRYENEDMRAMRFQPAYNSYNAWSSDTYGSSFGTSRSGDIDTQPPIMKFKDFLQTQDDNITDEEAVSKYAEYKLEFRRQQLNEFFVAHKEEEWFKLKYHPEDSLKRKEELTNALKKRASVFVEMMNSGRLDGVRVESDHGDAVVKLLDAVVIRLEGGTDLDLTVLDLAETAVQEKAQTSASAVSSTTVEEKAKDDEEDSKTDQKEVKPDEEPVKEEEKEAETGDPKPEPAKEEAVEEIDSDKEQSDEVVPLTPRPLHKTSSIFLRTISPRVTKSEIETICKKYPGFLRVSISDPQPEQHWFRRGWVTFRRDVNIKEICWNINNIRLKDSEMGAIVNRDLSRRVRSVSGLSAHKNVVLHDLKLCARIIQELDNRHQLWSAPAEEQESFGLSTGNPVLKGITEFLVEEASAEEEELLGEVVADDSKNKHSQALAVLDKLLLYLRIVYSVDYYNMSQYAAEDEMPNRCGIMHLRGLPSNTEVSQQEVTDYCESYRVKLEPLVRAPEILTDADLTALGAKSEEVEVEKFIQANTQELAKDKWLCPLSGKKFKGAQFVRKHIFNKFSDQLDEVKKEVVYFNNYLRDPKRPQLAEHPGNRTGSSGPSALMSKKEELGGLGGFHGGGGFFGAGGGGGGFKGRGGGFGHFGGVHPFGGRGRGFPRGGRSMDYRPLITYRDLDAPCEPDEII